MSEEQSASPTDVPTTETATTEDLSPVSMFELSGMTSVRTDEPKEEVEDEPESEEPKEDEEETEASDKEEEEPKETDDSEVIDLGEGIKESKKQLREILKTDKSIRARFGEVGRKEQQAKELLTKAEQLDRKTKEDLSIIAEHVGSLEKDPVAGVINVLDAFGADGRQVLRQVRKALEAQIIERLELSEAEREVLDAKEELEATRGKLQSREEKEKEIRQREAFTKQIIQTAEKSGLSHQEYQESFKQVNDLYNKGFFAELKEATPEQAVMTVIKHGLTVKTIGRIDSVLDGIDQEWKNDDTLMTELVQVATSIDCTDEDLIDIAKAIKGEAKAQADAPKAKRSQEVKVIEEDSDNIDTDLKPLGFSDLI